MSAFHFLRPAWLLALLPVLALLFALWRARATATGWRAFVAPALLAHLLLDADRSVRRLPLLLLGAGWLLAVVALAGPTWERQAVDLYRAPADRVIVLDMSPSMAGGDLQPDRLSRARLAIRRLLAGAREGRTALVVFGAEPHVVAPLTDDVATIEALLPALTIDILPVAGDRAAPALRLAGELLARVHSAQGTVLLVSDGVGDTADSLQASQALRQAGVRLMVLGVGTAAGAPVPGADGGFATDPDGRVQLARLDETGLAALASAGGGRYLRLGAAAPESLLQPAVARDPAQAKTTAAGVERWVERGPWLLLPLLLLAAAGYRRGWLGVLLILVLPPPPAQAFGWQDLWLRPDQQAARLLAQGEVTAAAARFADPDWRATARYRAGDYDAAAGDFAGDTPERLYNRGNALARAGHLQEALAAYDAALQQEPGHADARFNHDLVAQLLRAEQQPSGQQGDAEQDHQSGGEDGQPDDAGTSGQQGQDGGSDAAQQSAGEGQNGGDAAAQRGRQDDRAGDAPAPSAAGEPPQAADRQGQQAGNTAAPAGDPAQQAAESGQSGAGVGDKPPDATAEAADTAAGQADQASSRPAPAPTPGQAGADGPSSARPEPVAGSTTPDDNAASATPDSAQRARADVAPAPDRAHEGQGASVAGTAQSPRTEQDIAMEQWLRQIPDDPAGLLRRKFMVEHLLRQQGQHTP